MKILFLSHSPHPAHLEFMKTINAEVRVIPFKRFVNLSKKISIIGKVFPFISFLYGSLINPNYDVVISEGGTALYISAFLKLRNPKLKLILLDVDLFFFNYNPKSKLYSSIFKYIAGKIYGIIHVSEESKKYSSKYLHIPSEICPIPVKNITNYNKRRQNYGLYVGRLDPEKKIERIIDFVNQCKYLDKLYIVGGGTLEKKVKHISQINKKIVYIEETPNIEKYYNLCKFFIHLPDFDPHPSTTMEAALGGCIPIISSGCGTKYLFSKEFIVDPNNFKEINEKILFHLKNQKKSKILLAKSVKKIKKNDALNNFKIKFSRILKELKKSNTVFS